MSCTYLASIRVFWKGETHNLSTFHRKHTGVRVGRAIPRAVTLKTTFSLNTLDFLTLNNSPYFNGILDITLEGNTFEYEELCHYFLKKISTYLIRHFAWQWKEMFSAATMFITNSTKFLPKCCQLNWFSLPGASRPSSSSRRVVVGIVAVIIMMDDPFKS